MIENIFPHILNDAEVLTGYFGTECHSLQEYEKLLLYILLP